MIIDYHAHIFPFLGGANGFLSAQEHLRVLQLYMVGHSQQCGGCAITASSKKRRWQSYRWTARRGCAR